MGKRYETNLVIMVHVASLDEDSMFCLTCVKMPNVLKIVCFSSNCFTVTKRSLYRLFFLGLFWQQLDNLIKSLFFLVILANVAAVAKKVKLVQ